MILCDGSVASHLKESFNLEQFPQSSGAGADSSQETIVSPSNDILGLLQSKSFAQPLFNDTGSSIEDQSVVEKEVLIFKIYCYIFLTLVFQQQYQQKVFRILGRTSKPIEEFPFSTPNISSSMQIPKRETHFPWTVNEEMIWHHIHIWDLLSLMEAKQNL